MPEKKEIAIGGQAVIEGVMMRGPEQLATAIRRADGHIEVLREPFVSITKKNRFLGLPFVRGFVSLIEMMIIGYRTLSFSATRWELDNQDPKAKVKSDRRKKNEEFMSFVFALGLAFLVFGLFPYRLAAWMHMDKQSDPLYFNLVVGCTRVVMFVAYVWLIGLMKDVHRLFEYHGGEHCSVHAYENDAPLTPESACSFTTIHPRCGTSFMFFVLLIAILVFTIVDFLVALYLGKMPHWGIRFAYHLLLIPVISGLSYEILKLSGKYPRNVLVRALAFPGMALQHLTTQRPDESQAEVAIVAMKAALDMDLSEYPNLTLL